MDFAMLKKIGFILTLVLLLAMTGCKRNNVNISTEGKHKEQFTEVNNIEETFATVESKKEETEKEEAKKEETKPVIIAEFDVPEGEGVGSIDGLNTEVPEETNSIEENEKNTEATTPAEVEEQDQGCGCAYAEYLAKSPAEQEDYMHTFASPVEFIAWCKTAEAEHSSHVTVIEASGSELNIGDYIK